MFFLLVSLGNRLKIISKRTSPKMVLVPWDWPSPRMPVANEGLGWDPPLRIFDNPGAHCYWEGGHTQNMPTVRVFQPLCKALRL